MKTSIKTSFFALALATVTFGCDSMNKNDNVEGVADSTAVSNPTIDEAMNTSADTATVIRTDSTVIQEAEQIGNEAAGAVQSGANAVEGAAKDVAR